MQQYRLYNATTDKMIADEIKLYQKLEAVYQQLSSNKNYPFAKIMVNECLRAQASLDEANSQYKLAVRLLDEAKFRESLEQEVLFANATNDYFLKKLYQEVHELLEAATKNNHVLAVRLQGLCYINSWGVERDKHKGFEIVVKSIELSDSWQQVPQIFADIGLNKPEFFSALVKHRNEAEKNN